MGQIILPKPGTLGALCMWLETRCCCIRRCCGGIPLAFGLPAEPQPVFHQVYHGAVMYNPILEENRIPD